MQNGMYLVTVILWVSIIPFVFISSQKMLFGNFFMSSTQLVFSPLNMDLTLAKVWILVDSREYCLIYRICISRKEVIIKGLALAFFDLLFNSY